MALDPGWWKSVVPDLGGLGVFVVRHAEAAGQIDESPGIDLMDSQLSDDGRIQAGQVAYRFQREELTAVIASPMRRSIETAVAIGEATGAPIRVWMEVREVFPGSIRVSRGRSELAKNYSLSNFPSELDLDGWTHGDTDYLAMYARAMSAIRRLRETFGPEEKVAVVTHGGFGSYLLCAALGLPPHPARWIQLDNASVSVLRFPAHPSDERPDWEMFPPVEVELLCTNYVEHLHGHS